MSFKAYQFNHQSSDKEIVYYNNEQVPVFQIGIGSYTGNVSISDYTGNGLIKIGNFCSIANANFMLGRHSRNHSAITSHCLMPLVPYDEDKATADLPDSEKHITIGNDVWIGNGALILNGITIGDGAVIAAMTVVTKSVPSYALVAGNPGIIKKYRFSPPQIEALQKIAWWNWPAELIKERAEMLHGEDIEEFIKNFSS